MIALANKPVRCRVTFCREVEGGRSLFNAQLCLENTNVHRSQWTGLGQNGWVMRIPARSFASEVRGGVVRVMDIYVTLSLSFGNSSRRSEVHCLLNLTAESQDSEKKKLPRDWTRAHPQTHSLRKEESKGWKQDRQALLENLTQVIFTPPPT